MVKREVVVKNPSGFHFRPAGILCNEAVKYKCKITYIYGDNEANVKSVLSVLGSSVKFGAKIEICCDGEDEEEALEAIISTIENGLGEA